MKNKDNGSEKMLEESIIGTGTGNRTIKLYIFICITGLAVIIGIFNFLISDHDKKLSEQICSLVTEKVTSSIEYMNRSARDISSLISCADPDKMDIFYKLLKQSTDDAGYLSSGMFFSDGRIYATENDISDLEKWGLITDALDSQTLMISEPYRSSITGQLVFTIFSPIFSGEEHTGSLFITYPLDELLDITYSPALDKNTEVLLMDGYSDNIIRCTGNDSFLKGSWSNMKLNTEMISNPAYLEWANIMRSGAETASVSYSVDGSTYTQAFERIDCMNGWNVVVRIPNQALSGTMSVFRTTVTAYAVVLTAATIIMLVSFKKRSDEEKRALENLSVYDPLSQVLNRRAFEFSAANYLKRSGRTSGSVMFLDIDLFKRINDTYGHDTGDMIIKSTADNLKSTFGSCGIVSRYGGDEFVVLIKNKQRDELHEMMTVLQKKMREVKIEGADDFELHFSAGLADFPENGSDLKELMKCADTALYVVKEKGRNGFGWYEKPAE